MRYFAMGDSNMIGANTDPTHRNYGPDSTNFFNIVANHFNFEFDCWAKSGGSNDHILRMTEKWIAETPCDNREKFVFIGWSTWERQEHLVNHVYHDIDAWLINNPAYYPPELEQVADQLREKFAKDSNYLDSCGRVWAQKIYDFAQSLQQRGIGYFFWNAYMKLPYVQGCNFDHRYLLPYDDNGNQYFYIKRVCNHPTLEHDPYHFDTVGHRLWAERLIQHIDQWRILDDI